MEIIIYAIRMYLTGAELCKFWKKNVIATVVLLGVYLE